MCCVCVWLSQVAVIVFATPNTLANSYTHTYIHTYYLLVYATVIIIKWPSKTERHGVTERERECLCVRESEMQQTQEHEYDVYDKHGLFDTFLCVAGNICMCIYMYVCMFCKENMCFSHVIITKGLVFMS